MIKKLILLLPLSLCGCLVVRHEVTMPNGVKDSGSLKAFMTTDAAAKLNIHSSIKGTNYTHGASATELSVTGDTAFIQALSAGIAKGVLDALKATGGLPP